MTRTRPDLVLLNDEQVRAYIANGYVRIDLSVPGEVHEAIARKLDLMEERGSDLGNNVLPHAPEFRHVLNTPEVQGALVSLLGDDYIEYPHRYCHSKPPEEPPEDVAAQVRRGYHQDTYTPLARPRQHCPRFARIIYYPRDTPIAHGPTHVSPGTQFDQHVTDEGRAGAIPMEGPAGSLWITHFDISHGAGVNLSDGTRHMVKFIYMRRTEPASPSWNCAGRTWKSPEDLQAPWDLELAWSYLWDWMCGSRDRFASFRSNHTSIPDEDVTDLCDALDPGHSTPQTLTAIHKLAVFGPRAVDAVPALVALLNQDPQPVRITAIYALATIGEPAVRALAERMDRGDMESWSESAAAMTDEAHALAAIGTPAVAPLGDILDSAREWDRINASFSLGEMDSTAADAVPALAQCLDGNSHRLVRFALDALGQIGGPAAGAVPRISRFLVENRPDWEEILTRSRAWVARDQIRINAATALARIGPGAAVAERQLLEALDDPCGYVSLLATDALLHLDSPAAARAVSELVMAQRWDPSLTHARPW